MVVYRISKMKFYDDTTGTGSRLYGGRWNNIGYPCIYTSATRALAVLEYTVNVSLENSPYDLCMTTWEIPDDIMEFDISDLPQGWHLTPATSASKNFGTKFLKELRYPVLKVPSVIITEEFNYILNPLHPKNAEFKMIDFHNFFLDQRFKRF